MTCENLYRLLDPSVAADSATVLLTADGTAWSRADLRAAAGRMAALLAAAGIAPGDRVAVQVEKSPQALGLYLACLKIGAVFLPLNPGYTPREVQAFLEDAEPAVLVAGVAAAQALAATGKSLPRLFTLDPDGTGTLAAESARLAPRTEVTPRAADDLAAILYTSGTTGRAKGAMISHGNLAFTTRTLNDLWCITASDVLLHVLPVFHAHGLFVAAQSALAAGAVMHFLPKFTPEAVLDLLPRATLFMGVPTLYARLLADPRLTREACAGMRLFTCGSAPLSGEMLGAFAARTGHTILERYGMTETAIIASNPLDGARVAGSVGYALPGVDVRAADGEGRPVPAGEVGGIEIRGPNLFKGYWRMPERTAAEMRPDGFFITGDLGRRDADGRITLVGRSKDLIISGGYNVYPSEVEGVLARIPGVREAAVVGVPHADFGEGVIAVIERGPEGAGLDAVAVTDAAARDLARYKLPRRLEVMNVLPRNATGKVLKFELRKTFGGA